MAPKRFMHFGMGQVLHDECTASLVADFRGASFASDADCGCAGFG